MEKTDKKKLLVFLDISIDGDVFERMIFELFTDVAPNTAENFRALCTGEKGLSSRTGKPLHYKGTFFHHIIRGHVAQGGDFLRQDGNFGESIYDGKFPDEFPKLKHDGPGLLSMSIADQDERGSLFSITFKADHNLDRKCIVFGELVDGHEVLRKIERSGDEDGRPAVTVKIINSGEFLDAKKKGTTLKKGKDIAEVNSIGVKRKRKHKTSSNKRRKRRRHYSSESDASSESETESSESDSDSDSDVSSFSNTSSSSDERRKMRKRSKRERRKHRKGKDKRRERKYKRRAKKSKYRSKRDTVSDSGTDSKCVRSSEENGITVGESDSHKKTEFTCTNHKKGELADMLEREEGEFPRENGEHENDGVEAEILSDRSADRHPDVADDLPKKSCLSPLRGTGKSMSLSPRSPRKGTERSPNTDAKPDRSWSNNRNSPQISNRSRSVSPVRSGCSRSPSRSPSRRQNEQNSRLMPQARSHSPPSRSRSVSVSPPRRNILSPTRRSSLRLSSRSPARPYRRSISRGSDKPSRRSLSGKPVRSSHRSISRSPSKGSPRRRHSPSPPRAHARTHLRSYSRSPRGGTGRRARSPVSDRGRSSSRSLSIDGSPRRIRRGRGFSDRYSYAQRYRSRSDDRSPVRAYRYGGRNDRYASSRRSPRRYRSPPRGRTPPRYRGRSRSRSPISRSPIRYRNRRYSRSRTPIRSRSPVERYRGSPSDRRQKSPSRSRSLSASRSSHDSPSPRRATSKGNSRQSLGSPAKKGLVSYGDASPNSDRD